MAHSTFNLHEEGLTLLFGPQDPDINEAYTTKLRSTLLETPSLQWILETLIKLPQHWQSISETVPELRDFPGEKHLETLNEWLRRGIFPQQLFPLPNILVSPLVVITHLVQYVAFLKQVNPDLAPGDSLQATLKLPAEAIGLCTGLLSSAAVASSETLAELEIHGAVAIRMAMAIGASVDSGDTDTDSKGKWQSVAVGWTSPDAKNALIRVLKDFPEAYISVVSEEKLTTVTVPKSNAASLLEQLKDAGLIFAETALRGAFHCQNRTQEATSLIRLFDSNPAFQFPSVLAFPTRSATGGEYCASDDKLHHMATKAMLTDRADWHQVFTSLQSATTHGHSLVIAFGRERCLPQWLVRKLGPRLMQGADVDLVPGQLPARFDRLLKSTQDDAIAIVGLACHLPGGDDVNEFWKTLCAGKSQHTQVPADRLDFQTTAWREYDPERKWYGNFVKDHDAFDHRFFKKSSREMASTDPQQRLMLQVAYQAVEQSGYFNMKSTDPNIGCYVGIGVADYESNVANHAPNAYTATGTLKSFAAGKISHYFGWSGPGVTIDTACSSSAVAVHQACRAILSGECSAALAGGTSIMSSPEWYQNLDGASFLSPSGQCKPFDKDADGYCRGEGAGAVFLKKLSSAIEDGNQIFGVIHASSVNQNENCSAITAPSVLSLSNVFRSVIRKAGLDPKQISLVEAHGTGTTVGDKAEYDSIRKVFGGPGRTDRISLGSVKGLIGHLECASGIAALVKTLLMIHHGAIPPQPSFQTLSPKLNASPSDNIEIATKLKAWDTDFRVALLNNYGASGSNASLIVSEALSPTPRNMNDLSERPKISKSPFWLAGLDGKSLRSYSAKLLQLLRSSKKTDHRFTLANLSFQLFRQSNRLLNQALIFSCSSVDQLDEKLDAFANERGDVSTISHQESSRPVILCFGGQTSTFVGLDREIHDQVKLLRTHLDQCNEACLSLGLQSIFPAIFQREPVEDVAHLQTMLFAIQYSCAKSWIDSGVQVAAVVGHSFGELTAMCISGVLSVKDTLKMIAGRTRIIQEKWGPEKGGMMAVEGDRDDVERLLCETSNANPEESAPTIACFNGPRSFTLSGTTKAMEMLKETIASNQAFSSIKMKQLDVTNAFHSTLVDSLMADLATVGGDLIFREPIIHHEKATKDSTTAVPMPGFVASHMRNPVYFNDAVQRLAKRYPSSIWLEAGSNSGITIMASRAQGSPKSSHFQPINITSSGAFQHLTNATVDLWKEGLNTTFWAHHAVQTSDYSPILLPPYQFEKSKHWMDRKRREQKRESPVQQLLEAPKGLWTFLGYQDVSKSWARFQVNTTSEKFLTYISAHVIAQTAPICPSALTHVIAMDALVSLVAESDLLPELQGMESSAPLCVDSSRCVWIDAKRTGDDHVGWDWSITSTSVGGAKSDAILHVSGRIIFRHAKDAAYDFAKYERLVDRKYGLALLDGPDADQVILGSRNIYKAFSGIVQYNDDEYRGLQKIAAKGNESAGRIIWKQDDKEMALSVGLADTFCQVAGIFLNCMTDCEDSDMFLSNRVDQWIRSPKFPHDSRPKQWEVYARHHRPSDKEYVSDIFVFDATSGELVWVILGLHFVKVSISGMARLLARLSPGLKKINGTLTPPSTPPQVPIAQDLHHAFSQKTAEPAPKPVRQRKIKKKSAPQRDVLGGARGLLCNLLGLDAEEVKPKSDLVELGIDSLLAMEVAREVENEFKIKLELEELMEMTDFQSLVICIQSKLGISDDSAAEEDEEDEEKYENNVGIQTPADSEDGMDGILGLVNGDHTTPSTTIPASVVLDTFAESKQLTDQFIEEHKFANYMNDVLPRQNEMVVIHIADAFEQMGCSIRTAEAGQVLDRVSYLPKHEQVMAVFYDLLEKARLVDLDGSRITRTAIPVSSKSAATLLQELLRDSPEHSYDHKLTSLTGTRLADCLTGKTDGIQIIFGSPEGRELVAGTYALSPMNTAWIGVLEHFWKQLALRLPKQSEPINILELGAGTGGTTAKIVPLLASSGIPFQYTVTDISPSLVAGLRKRFKHHPFMRFEIFDIEKAPSADLLHRQHVVMATNCVHATQSLARTTKNIHDVLRPDGFLIMLEMSMPIPWVDSVFGLVAGWWAFNDGRKHALSQPFPRWEDTLKGNGYGHVDWSDGDLPENAVQHIILAMASGPSYDRVPILPKPLPNQTTDIATRQAVVDSFVEKYTRSFSAPTPLPKSDRTVDPNHCVLVTGATGSLGSHLVAYFASQPNIRKVICLNRISSIDSTGRQQQALESRGLVLSREQSSKLEVFESDTSKPKLGLSAADYKSLANSVDDIVHNAWAMSMTRPVRAFELQIKTMRNLIDFARECACRRQLDDPKIGFQFISSVSVVGYHPSVSGKALAQEERVSVDSVLPMGYAEAKLICECMLDETLHHHPEDFRAMAVRVGQISGSKTNGYWNPVEHLVHLIKSSQTLRALPDLDGVLSWCPVNDVAATLGELLLGENPAYPIYHIENPVRQSWRDMISILAEALHIPQAKIISYEEWVRRVREFPPSMAASENPAARLVEFFDKDFIRMSCGGLILDTAHSKEHSKTLRNLKGVDKELVMRYIRAWKETGFLR